MLFDTHCHINDEAYKDDRAEMMARAFEAGVGCMVCPGTGVDTSASAIELARVYDEVYAAVGYHPEEAAAATDEGFAQMTLTKH